MKPWVWLRTLAVILALFAAGHTLGTAAPRVTRGAREAALFADMQSFRFPVMGFERTYWDFYRGFALTISVLMVFMVVIAWQASSLSRRDARAALPITVTLLLGCVGMLILGCFFFFGAPIAFSAVAVAVSAVTVIASMRVSPVR